MKLFQTTLIGSFLVLAALTFSNNANAEGGICIGCGDDNGSIGPIELSADEVSNLTGGDDDPSTGLCAFCWPSTGSALCPIDNVGAQISEVIKPDGTVVTGDSAAQLFKKIINELPKNTR